MNLLAFLRPAIVFDIDETILKTPANNSKEALLSSQIYPIIGDLLNAYTLFGDSPLFFCTSRCETLRSETMEVLDACLGDNIAHANLFMRPKEMNDWAVHTPFEVRRYQIEAMKEWGYRPGLVFDDNIEALRAYAIYAPDAILFKADPFNRLAHTTREEWDVRDKKTS